ncbi:MAG: hypothetical protein A3G04_01765 [Candidatus Taylorbacteria bacterium RIFCSPLOWO2_12_FULL_44_9]|nr:MAG: hypothetical protein A3G04_01765 [Candidatus Taylorbacteria bacterium RIFCSPLOWO2_12_FULL_44_9]
MEITLRGECNVIRVMAHRNGSSKKDDKLSQEDISELSKFFYLLWQMDEKNKREGKYDNKQDERK